MSVYKPSNFYPNLQEIDITKDNEFSCQVNTSGESIQAYKIQILSGSGEEIVAESQCIDTTAPIRNKSFLKIGGVSNKLDSDLINGKDYQWGVRTYNVKKGSTKQPNTVVCNGFLVGSTRYVIWAKNNVDTALSNASLIRNFGMLFHTAISMASWVEPIMSITKTSSLNKPHSIENMTMTPASSRTFETIIMQLRK